MASKRARRMKEELKQAQAERDTAIKAAVELKNKLTTVKQNSRKEIAALQAKLAKVSLHPPRSILFHMEPGNTV